MKLEVKIIKELHMNNPLLKLLKKVECHKKWENFIQKNLFLTKEKKMLKVKLLFNMLFLEVYFPLHLLVIELILINIMVLLLENLKLSLKLKQNLQEDNLSLTIMLEIQLIQIKVEMLILILCNYMKQIVILQVIILLVMLTNPLKDIQT